ncbi:MAG TPA: DUF1206 domain-containing protein [Bdellovibrionales bacterium]|nr:DUF1206 domain-containing protein [Bdellovibrionales bacterium]
MDSRIESLGRFGFFAKGVIYTIAGASTALAAAKLGGEVADSKDVLVDLARSGLGRLALILVGLGFAAHAVWRLYQAAFAREERRKNARLRRLGKALNGAFHSFLSYSALKMGLFFEFPRPDPEDKWTSYALSLPFGPWLVIAAGVSLAIFGLQQLRRAYREEFAKHLNALKTTGTQRRWIVAISKFGISSRAVTFVIMGAFLAAAGLHVNPREAKNVRESLFFIASQPFGRTLIALIAAGFFAFGIYCLARSWLGRRSSFAEV